MIRGYVGSTVKSARLALLSFFAGARFNRNPVKSVFTRKTVAAAIVFVTTFAGSVWLFRVFEAPQPIEKRAVPVVTPREEPQELSDIFTGDETTVYRGYKLRRLHKTVIYGHRDEEVVISYAALERNGQRVLEFDDVYFVEGNSTEFGLFNLLGNNSRQFIISQTVPRGGRHWVVDVSWGAQVVFDSAEYSAGREEFYVIDLDKDGVYEISLPVTAFYEMQDKMYIGEIPLPELIFKYDANLRKYVRANHLFPDYTLHGIEQDIAQLRDDDSNYLSKRLDILLRYIFARKSDEGWAFFNREYHRPDKEEIKNRIQGILKQRL